MCVRVWVGTGATDVGCWEGCVYVLEKEEGYEPLGSFPCWTSVPFSQPPAPLPIAPCPPTLFFDQHVFE